MGAEGVPHRQHARRERDEVERVDAGHRAGRMQYQVDGRVGVVVTEEAGHVEAAQVVFVGAVRAMPGDHIERRMPRARAPEVAVELGQQFEVPSMSS
jgi:hypothetical protein